ncbi:MAG TPA: hypothetical protein DCQ06_06595, partial [Myxococcales bacterium]|nr:hypothetical protein [Myxococcales bacterium]
DCDGETDEDVVPQLKTCRRVGVCSGLPDPVCTNGIWDCKYSDSLDYESEEKSCDGKDNDCDGIADANLSLGALPGGDTCQDKGLCAGGVAIVCKGGEAVCDYVSVPGYQAIESECDGKDNDCDGQIDNLKGTGMPLLNSDNAECLTVGVCKEAIDNVNRRCTAGKWACDYGQVPYYEANETLCDNRDNDCDGKVDNDLVAPKPSPCGEVGVCSEGVAQCAAGLWTCDWDGLASKGYEVLESSCDGKDNDCDGKTDTLGGDVATANQCKTQGVCGVGVTVSCTAGAATCDYSLVLAHEATEISCDGKDNDCDGQIDEPDSLDASDSGCALGVCAASAKATCSSGKWQCSFAGVADYESKETLCDGKDNDCDGQTDEALSNVVAAQCKNLGVCAGTATAQCTQGKYTCGYTSTDYQPKENLCDSKDNDCDGQTDTAVCQAGQACTTNPQCATGGCAAVLGDTASVCTPKANQCAQRDASGSLNYVNNGAITCADGGSTLTCSKGTFEAPKACPTANPACVNGKCQLCKPNEQRCDAQKPADVVKCNGDGTSQTKVTTCASGQCSGAGVCVLKGTFDISQTNIGANHPAAISFSDGTFVVAWIDAQILNNVVVFQRFKADGTKEGALVAVSDKYVPDDARPAIAKLGTGFAVAWTTENTIIAPSDVIFRRYDATAKPVAAEEVIGTSTLGVQRRPAMATTAEGLVLLWESQSVDISGYGVVMQRYDTSGQKVGSQVLVNANANANATDESGDEGWPSVVVAGNDDLIVAWTQVEQGNGNVRVRRLSKTGAPLTASLSITQGMDNIIDVKISLSSSGAGHLVWQQYNSGSPDIYYLALSKALSAVGAPVVVHSVKDNEQSMPALANTSDDRTIIAFQSYSQANGYDVRMRSRLATGAWSGNDSEAVGGAGEQDQSAILPFSDGRVLLLWRNRTSDIAKGVVRAEFL